VTGNMNKLVALLILGLVIGTCLGYGVLSIPQPKLAFDLRILLTFVWMLVWTIRKRHGATSSSSHEVVGRARGLMETSDPGDREKRCREGLGFALFTARPG